MANEVKYIHPLATKHIDADFTDLLPNDTNLNLVCSEVMAEDSAHLDVSMDILTNIEGIGMVLGVDISNVIDGEDYLITFLGCGATHIASYTIEIRSRSKIDGNV